MLLATHLLQTSTAIAFAASDNPISALASQPPDRAFWRSVIEHKFQLPDISAQPASTLELAAYVGASDPELRDQFGYKIQRHYLHDFKRAFSTRLKYLMAYKPTAV